MKKFICDRCSKRYKQCEFDFERGICLVRHAGIFELEIWRRDDVWYWRPAGSYTPVYETDPFLCQPQYDRLYQEYLTDRAIEEVL